MKRIFDHFYLGTNNKYLSCPETLAASTYCLKRRMVKDKLIFSATAINDQPFDLEWCVSTPP